MPGRTCECLTVVARDLVEDDEASLDATEEGGEECRRSVKRDRRQRCSVARKVGRSGDSAITADRHVSCGAHRHVRLSVDW